MDVYKLGFLISQIVALAFLTIAVLRRNKLLQAKFIGRVKLRLIKLNEEAGITEEPVLLTEPEKAALGAELESLDMSQPLESCQQKNNKESREKSNNKVPNYKKDSEKS